MIHRRGLHNLPVMAREGWACQTAKQHLGLKPQSEKVNAHDSLPTKIDTSRDEGQGTPKYIYKLGKQTVLLYKNGIKSVWKNYRQSKNFMKENGIMNTQALIRHVQDTAYAQSLKNSNNSNGLIKPSENHITRAQYQRILRSMIDFPKLPLFAVIFGIFFEFTPLIVAIFPRITPSTCVLPFQQRRDLNNVNKKIISLKEIGKDNNNGDDEKTSAASVHQLTRPQLNALAGVFFYRQVLPSFIYPSGILKNKIKSHIDRVKTDDILLSRYGSVAALSTEELHSACLDRAIPIQDKSDTQLKADLLLWMVNMTEGKYDAGFFFYPISTTVEEAEVVNNKLYIQN